MPFNAPAKNVALDGLDESIAAGIDHVGINTMVTAPPSDTTPGTGTDAAATEASGGGYARKTIVWDAATGGTKANNALITFDVPAGTYGFVTFWNALTGNTNNYLGYAPINGTIKGFATVDAADVTANTITSAGHGLVNTDRVIFFNVYAESLPTGITEGAAYFVVGATTDTFQISLTSGGAAVDLTAIGESFFQKVIPEVFASTGQITIAAGALVLDGNAF